MLLVILLWIVILFIKEVLLGSGTEVYNAEIGYEATFDQADRLSSKEFFTELIPFIIFFAVLPILLLSVIF
jgi:hypothetical protein